MKTKEKKIKQVKQMVQTIPDIKTEIKAIKKHQPGEF